MLQLLKDSKYWTKYLSLFGFIVTILLLVTVVFKNDEEIRGTKYKYDESLRQQDLASIKEFLISKIKSPFININYEIKSGDSIQKILKKLEVQNKEIQTVISQYKKYSNPNQLLVGNFIDIVVEKNLTGDKNSISKFSIPVTKSTTIEIVRDEDNNITSNKIITKLYKKEALAENIILNNLYTAAIEAKINPDTISLTWVKSRLCSPSPVIVKDSPVLYCLSNIPTIVAYAP